MLIVFLCLTGLCSAAITVLPATTVAVGQEVYFDANGVTVPTATHLANGLVQGFYEWDWGDTTTSKRYDYATTYQQGGNPIMHIFMRPGTFTVTVTVTDAANASLNATATTTMTVTGTWPKLPPLPATAETLWLKLEDNLNDSSGNGLNGAAVGSPTYSAAAAENKGLIVSSSANYAQVADNDLLEGMSALTVTLWARKSAKTDSGYLIQKAGSYYIRLKDATTVWGAIFAGGTANYNSQSSYGTINNTWWHYYALTYDGTTIRTYLDGVEIDTTPGPITGTVTANTATLKIGESFSGTIDEVKVFRACLTQDELTRRFELRHAPIHARTEQYIQVSVPGRYTTDATNTMGLTVTGAVTGLVTLQAATANIASTTNIAMNNTALGIDSYTLTATLKNAGGTTLTTVSDYFAKTYAGSATEAAHALPLTEAATLTNLYVWTPDPGETGGWSVAVYVDGILTAQSLSVGDGETSKTDTDDVAVAEDSRVTVKITSAGTPNAGRIKWAITYTSTVQFFGGVSTALASSTRYLNLKGSDSSSSNVTRFVCPCALTLGHLHCKLSVAPGADKARAFTVQKGGVNTALTVAYGAADSGLLSDDAHTVACVAGDDIRLACTVTGTPAAANLTFYLDSTQDTAANFVISMGGYATANPLDPAAENYTSANNDLESPTATIANVDLWCPAMTVTAIYAILNAAPDNGAGTQQWTVALFEEDVASALSMVIAEAATTGNDTDAGVAIALGNRIAYGFTPSGTPIATDVPRGVSICAQIDEAAPPASDNTKLWWRHRRNSE